MAVIKIARVANICPSSLANIDTKYRFVNTCAKIFTYFTNVKKYLIFSAACAIIAVRILCEEHNRCAQVSVQGISLV